MFQPTRSGDRAERDSQVTNATPRAFRGMAGHLVTAVSVVIALVDGEPLVTTAGSVVAASWDPPLLAVLFQRGSRMAAALDHSARFTVNVLGEADHGLARRFARPDREQGWAALLDAGLLRRDPAPPVLESAVAWADCAVVSAIPIGDHRCFVGEVRDLDRNPTPSPLAYHRGRFHMLGPAVAPASWDTFTESELQVVW
jgi:flavin reductase (DIM6/NTAB) family NADH-FMN oxidoreductase RutF